MNYRIVLHLLGLLMFGFTLGMTSIIPFAVWYREWSTLGGTITSIVIGCLVGGGMILAGRNHPRDFFRREAVAVTSLAWICASALGTLPFYFGGLGVGFTDCFFEATSGLTTTGSTILKSIEDRPQALLFWRSALHFIGGLGIIVFFVVLMPSFAIGGKTLFKQEVAGPVVEGITPRIRDTATRLFYLYLGMNIVIALLLMVGGLTFFEAINHAMATVATGGFGTENTNCLPFSAFAQWVLTVGMFMSGANFVLHLEALRGNWRCYFRNSEFVLYFSIQFLVAAIITGLLYYHGSAAVSQPGSFNARDAFFATVSMGSTTGFGTVDFSKWPEAARFLLLVVMAVGGMVGGTSGGLKVLRTLVVGRALGHEVRRELSPRELRVLKVDGRSVSQEVAWGVLCYFAFYFLVLFASSAIVMVLNPDFSMVESGSAVLACLNGCGPGLDRVGPWGSFADFTSLTKYFLSVVMWIGRLEIYPLILVLSWRFWNPK